MAQKNTSAILVAAMAIAAWAQAATCKEPTPAIAAAAAAAADPIARQNRVIREFFGRLVNGPTGKPGVWLDVEGRGVNRYTRTEKGYLRTTRDFDNDGALRTPWTVTYNVDEARGLVIMNNGASDFAIRYARDAKDQYRSSRRSVPAAPDEAEYIETTRFASDSKEVISGGETRHAVWRSESDAIAQQAAKAKLVAAQTEVQRTQARLAALQADARQREMDDDIRRREAKEADQQAQIAQMEDERVVAHAQWEEESRRSAQELEDSLRRLRDSTAEYEAIAKRLSTAPAAAPHAGGNLGIRIPPGNSAGTKAMAVSGRGDDIPAASDRPGAANNDSQRLGKPLKFKLAVGLMPKLGDTVNPSCVSTVITRGTPGPGWGSSDFNSNSNSNYAKAMAEVERVKPHFLAVCSASGRTIDHPNDIHMEWNQTAGSTNNMNAMGAHNKEDVIVNVP